MKIITLAHQKGGVGKSTLTLNIAACLALNDNLSVAIVDNDPQGSLTATAGHISGLTFLPMPGNGADLGQLPYDVLLIDTPPYLSNQLADLFAVSDLVVVPTKIGYYDLMAIRATVELLHQAQAKRQELKAAIVLNMVKPRTRLNAELGLLLADFGIPVCQTTIADRIAYTRSAITSGVFKTNDETAKREIVSLTRELLTQLGI